MLIYPGIMDDDLPGDDGWQHPLALAEIEVQTLTA